MGRIVPSSIPRSRRRRAVIGLSLFVVVVLAALTATVATAQTQTATLVGAVTDTTGAVIPHAQVSVVNTGTEFHSETTTSAEGGYYVPYLPPGSYRITVEATGFKRNIHDGVIIRTGETPRVDVEMELGSVTDSVEVTAQSPLLNTDTAVVGQIMEKADLEHVEAPQGHVIRFLANFTTVEFSGVAGDWHIAGQRAREMGYNIDGMNAKTPGVATVGDTDQELQPNAEALQEVSVNTSGLSAEYGHQSGAMNMVFKSGTNSLHGSLDERYMWKALVQRDYLTQAPLLIPLYYDWFNGVFDGPVVIPKLYNGRNRTFFLVAVGAFLQSGGQPVSFLNVPTAGMLNGNFNFAANSLTIYDPNTIRQNSAGTWVSDPFPGNQMPVSRIDPVVKNFLSHSPFAPPNSAGIMTQTGPQQNFTVSQAKLFQRFVGDLKIDHQFSAAHKIFGRFSREEEPVNYHIVGAFQAQVTWPLVDTGHQLSPVHNYNAVFDDTYILSPSRFNDLRIGYNRRDVVQTSDTDDTNWSSQLGIPNMSAKGFPVFSIPTYGYFGLLGYYHQSGVDYTVQDNYTQIVGKHTFKVGYELMKTTYNSTLQVQPSGTYTFGGTEAPFTPNTGNPFADFLLGTVTSGVYTQSFATWLPRWWHHSWYVQDDWKPVRGLTVNLGLRWTYESPFSTKYGQESQFDPTVADPLTGKMGAITHPKGLLAKRDLNNFQPRLGLAWNFRPKWVFRSSFGIVTSDLGTNGVNQNFNEYLGTSNVQQAPGNPLPAFTLSQGPPSFSYPVQSNGSVSYVGTNYSARNADWYDPHMRMPYVMLWSAGLQYEFAHNWVVDMNYQGTAGVGLLENWNINQIPLNVSTNPTVLNQIYAAQQNYLPYPQFGAVYLYSNFGHSTYHSGTVRVEKRYTAGLTLMGTFTWSKAIDESDTDGTATGEDYYNRRLEKGDSGYNVPRHFEFLGNYELPVGKGRHFMNRGGVLNAVLGGWNVMNMTAIESGTAFSVTFASGPNKYLPGGGVVRPNILVPNAQGQTANWTIGPNRFPTASQNPYLQFSAFAYPASFTAGNLGRNTFRGPAMDWQQWGLSKTWAIHERFKATLRAEGNNFPIKHPELLTPNSSYNINTANLFGTFTTTRSVLSSVGQARPHVVLGCRLEF